MGYKITLVADTPEAVRDGFVKFIRQRAEGKTGQKWMDKTKTEKAIRAAVIAALNTLADDLEAVEVTEG